MATTKSRWPPWLRLLHFWLFRVPNFVLTTSLEIIIANLKCLIPDSWLPKKSICGQKVLVTGAANGMGRLVSLALAREGASVYLLDLDENGLKSLETEINESGGDARAYRVDLADRSDVDRCMQLVKAASNDHVHIVFLNAGLVGGKRLEQLDVGRTMQLINVMRHVVPGWYEHDGGHLVSMGSVCSFWGAPHLVDYTVSKHAALGFTKALHEEMRTFGCTGLKVTLICPFYISTGMADGASSKFPCMLPIMTPEYVCRKVMDALLAEKELLILPRFFWLLYVLERWNSFKTRDRVVDFFGLSYGMERLTTHSASS